MAASPSVSRVKWSGLVVAGTGFLLTRYTVASTFVADLSTLAFLVGEAPFLVVGLGLSAFGVALTVSASPRAYVDTVAVWCLLGVGGVGLVVVLSTAESMLQASVVAPSATFVPRVLLGGAVGGVLTGLYSAHTREQRASLSSRSDRLTVLNRLLRHEILNKLSIISGYADLEHPEATERIHRNAGWIGDAVDQVRLLTATSSDPVVLELAAVAGAAVDRARERYPHADIHFEADDDVEARVTPQVEVVFDRLLENAVEYSESETPRIELRVEADGATARVVIADDGPGLPPAQRALLRERSLPEFDDPNAGFGLTIARLLLDECDAGVEVRVRGGGDGGGIGDGPVQAGDAADRRPSADATDGPDRAADDHSATRAGLDSDTAALSDASSGRGPVRHDGAGRTQPARDGDLAPTAKTGTTISLTFPRVYDGAAGGVSAGRLQDAVVASLVAGFVMGGLLAAVMGVIPVIGALYGASNAIVGWITHLFHSVVFGLAFAAAVTHPSVRSRISGHHVCVALGVLYGVALSLVAAGVVMPLWLRAVGIPAPVPNLSVAGLVGHAVWGAVLGGTVPLARWVRTTVG